MVCYWWYRNYYKDFQFHSLTTLCKFCIIPIIVEEAVISTGHQNLIFRNDNCSERDIIFLLLPLSCVLVVFLYTFSNFQFVNTSIGTTGTGTTVVASVL